MRMTRPGLGRRELLRAAGASAVLFPFVRELRADTAAARPPRLVLLMQSNGTNQGNFWPSPDLTPSPILDPLLGPDRLRERTVVVKGLANRTGGSGNGHDFGFAGLYSGYRTIGQFNDPWGNGISIDQDLRIKLKLSDPFPTLNCGVLASDTPRYKDHRASFSYLGPQRQVPCESNVYKLYARFFPPLAGGAAGDDPVANAETRLAQKKTVLDYVATDLRNLRSRLGSAEREKLDAHEGALRSFESRLGATLQPAAKGHLRCSTTRAPLEPLDVTREDNVPQLVPLMLDFVATALACNLTRLVTFQFGNGGEKWFFRWLGINENSHDDIAHRDNGLDLDVTNKLLKINVWYAEQVARLARSLWEIPEEGGTVLDNSLIVWGNEIATGPHGMDDIPIVLVGRAAGRLKRTGYLVDAGPQDYRRLGCSLLNIMGVPSSGFGESANCGVIDGLELA